MLSNEQIIGQALDRIEAGYVFADKVEDIDAAIRRRLAVGEYDDLDGPVLCETVTAHLQQVCPDKHLRLLWVDQPQSLDPADEDGGRAAFLALLRAENQGIRRVEHLDGNVGLIDVRRIAYADEGAAAIGAAMQLVALSSALILDLRGCAGGAPEGAAMWHQLGGRRGGPRCARAGGPGTRHGTHGPHGLRRVDAAAYGGSGRPEPVHETPERHTAVARHELLIHSGGVVYVQ
ncbi:hypothetical protein [Micromonospora sp. WMMD710]|uniref:hypothetical protein n=1 Tax=Micromonospora sp. WMMD710 TaxID=3016085 RepID=UPI0024165FB3|nr:hypothetical protein [Micromonospora sp. WMMD710]MDG4758154.1 hypothetical protein [Micromonospora sp. WMMD710]